jgi:hypothetical protein
MDNRIHPRAVTNVSNVKGSLTTRVSGAAVSSADCPNGLTTFPLVTVTVNGVAVINAYADKTGAGQVV